MPANARKQPDSGGFLENAIIPHVQRDGLQMRLIERSFLFRLSCDDAL